MKIFNPSFSHRTLFSLVVRSLKILKRYGLTTKKMESNLRLYLSTLKKHGITPTFPIPANVLDNHQALIKFLANGGGIQFAIHGYDHIDHTGLSYNALSQHLKKAVRIFQEQNVPFSGFRFPYLKWNPRYAELLKELSLKWDSSDSILWEVVQGNGRRKRDLTNYRYMLSKYNYKRASEYFSLPKFNNGILQIPVSLPDDDLLIDRLGIKNAEELHQIWTNILEQTYTRGELFVLQLHPERIHFCKEILDSLIQYANSLNPRIWVASLDEITKWWNERKAFSIDIQEKGNDEYIINTQCSNRAAILVRTNRPKGQFANIYSVIEGNKFTFESAKRPIIGVSANCSPMLLKFLNNEGFSYEIAHCDNNYSVFFDNSDAFDEKDEKRTLRKIESTNFPLLRFWRWPYGHRSAFAITGDIDALTSFDFCHRLFGSL